MMLLYTACQEYSVIVHSELLASSHEGIFSGVRAHCLSHDGVH